RRNTGSVGGGSCAGKGAVSTHHGESHCDPGHDVAAHVTNHYARLDSDGRVDSGGLTIARVNGDRFRCAGRNGDGVRRDTVKTSAVERQGTVANQTGNGEVSEGGGPIGVCCGASVAAQRSAAAGDTRRNL